MSSRLMTRTAQTSGQAEPSVEAGQPAGAPRARDRIFAAAKEMFYRQGIRAVGVESIVAAAGATKMSLYRSFPSKDDLVVAYLKERDALYWQWWDDIMDRHAGNPRAQLRALVESVAKRTLRAEYRGCPFTNAVTEFPETDNPGHEVAVENKRELRARLRNLAAAVGAREPALLGDQLFLLMEGAYASGHVMGGDGPPAAIVAAADALVEAQLR
jgi:AcrR family transcriptional regulator